MQTIITNIERRRVEYDDADRLAVISAYNHRDGWRIIESGPVNFAADNGDLQFCVVERNVSAQETSAYRAIRMLSECKEEDLAGQHHALVYGRVRVWHNSLKDTNEIESHWSRYAWWKAMWYPHRGSPSDSGAWGVYGGSDGYTGPGDADLSHYEPLPPAPLAAAPAADEGMPK